MNTKDLKIKVEIPGLCNKEYSIDDIKILIHTKGFDFKEQTKDDDLFEYLYLIYTKEPENNKILKVSSLDNMNDEYINPSNALPTFQIKAFDDLERGLNTKIEWTEYVNLVYKEK